MKTVSENIVTLDRDYYTTCSINFHGATVVSWRIRNLEQLFVSRQTVFDDKKPIQGGISLIFPHFGDWNFGPQHGFARIMRWKLEKAPARLPNGDVEVVLSLTDDDFTRSMWNYPFRLMYRITLLERELHFNITVCNLGKELPFAFHLVSCTYFKVPDVEKCEITGLMGSILIDMNKENEPQEIDVDSITVNEFTENFYHNTPKDHEIKHTIDNRTMQIEKINFPDTIIWNPWITQDEDLTDLGDNEYRKMICFRIGNITEPIKLLAKTTFEAGEKFKVIKEFEEKYINLY